MLRNIAIILRGSIVAQAIVFLILPVLTRQFTPEDFGNFQLFQSVLSILMVFAAMRYEIALLRAENDLELRATFWLCLAVTALTSILVSIVAAGLLGSGWLAAMVTLSFSVWLFPLALLAGGIAQFLTYVVAREAAFSVTANSKMVQSSVFASVALLIGAVAPVSSGLIVADLAGRIALAGVLLFWCFRRRPDLFEPAGKGPILAAAGKYRGLPIVALPGAVANSVGSVVTPMMIYAIYSPSISGQFALVERSLSIPLALAVTAVSQVYMAGLAEAIRTPGESALLQYRKVVRNLVLIGLPPMLVLIAFGPFIFQTLFGPNWALAGEFARILAPAYVFLLAAGGVNTALLVIGRQKLQFAWDIGRLIVLVAIWIAIPVLQLSEITAVILYTMTTIATSAAFLAMTDLALRAHGRSAPAGGAPGQE